MVIDKEEEIPNLFLIHLENSRKLLIELAKSAAVLEHGGNLGTVREGFITNFLERNMPEAVSYHSGEIFDSRTGKSGQIDIVLHPHTSPKLNVYGAINLFPVETVLAAIEVKSNLKKTNKKNDEIKNVITACHKVKKLERKWQRDTSQTISSNTGKFINVNSVPYIVFAYKGCTEKTLYNHMETHAKTINQNGKIVHEYLPDLILVLDRGYCLEKKQSDEGIESFEDRYLKLGEKNEFVLLGLFDYLIRLINDFAENQSSYIMPIDKYKKIWKSVTAHITIPISALF
ncbi:MAG: DUF6602 domain-containing protein [Gammaproteobacteria bacterium]